MYNCLAVVTCADPRPIPHCLTQSSGITYNSTATYTCDKGYQISQLVGDILISTCTSSGEWDAVMKGCFSKQ